MQTACWSAASLLQAFQNIHLHQRLSVHLRTESAKRDKESLLSDKTVHLRKPDEL